MIYDGIWLRYVKYVELIQLKMLNKYKNGAFLFDFPVCLNG